jgi:3-dehydroquinate synthase
MHKIIPIRSVLGDYNVTFTDALADVEALLDNDNTFTFIDETVQQLYPFLYRPNNISVKCIESNKTLDVASSLLQRMMELNIKSNSTILVIGGGILQDLVGFCCSVYHRGIKYILIPTTLLAQADSCIGGKTSINFHKKKNILGTFFPPNEIIIHTGFLNTLTDIEYISGMGEIFKFHILQNQIDSFDIALDKTRITDIIFDVLQYKNSIITIDEFDTKERKFLNFGHTFGHALEFTSNNKLPHGIGVILGCVVSCIISKQVGCIVPNLPLILQYAKYMLKDVELHKEWFDTTAILEAVKQDKKNTGKIIDVLISDTPVLYPIEDMSLIDRALIETFQLINDR